MIILFALALKTLAVALWSFVIFWGIICSCLGDHYMQKSIICRWFHIANENYSASSMLLWIRGCVKCLECKCTVYIFPQTHNCYACHFISLGGSCFFCTYKTNFHKRESKCFSAVRWVSLVLNIWKWLQVVSGSACLKL